MRLQNLLDGIDITEIKGDNNPLITGVVSDHRQVKQGNVFISYQGLNVDGFSFIDGAIQNGAKVIVSEKKITQLPNDVTSILTPNGRIAQALIAANWHGNPAKHLKLTGITGTNGKTSTAHLTYGILKAHGYKAAVLGTVGHSYQLNDESRENKLSKIEIPALLTTPDPFELHAMLRQFVEAGIEHIVMETSSQGLAQHRLTGLNFETAVFTNLTQDHLDYHITMENYMAAKLMLFKQLRSEGVAILNADSSATSNIKRQLPNRRVKTYGIQTEADLTAQDIHNTLNKLTFTAITKDKDFINSIHTTPHKIQAKMNLLGSYNIYNALAAICVGLRYKCSDEAIREGLAKTVVPGRFENVTTDLELGKEFAVIVDYAHTPDGLENVLLAARDITEGKLVSVFGCGGDRDTSKRPKMGEISTNIADFSVITSDNPRTENPDKIITDIVSNLPHDAAFVCISNRQEAIRYAIMKAKKGDVVVIAGKGHENYQEINGKRFPFDDREIATEILNEI